MILTGPEIGKMVREDRVIIEPYSEDCLDPNSYSFHLGETILEYEEPVLDVKSAFKSTGTVIPPEGFVLLPDRFYLGHTYEKIGGINFASEMYANLSTALCGMFIQFSAPLGHTGAVINWTLEIVVAQPLIIYPRMRLGKICFWKNLGSASQYSGRYCDSTTVIPSKIAMDGI